MKQNKDKSVVNSLFRLIKTSIKLFKHPIMIVTMVYIIVLFYLLNYIGLIKGIDLIKDYIKLLLFALLPMIFRVATNYKQINITQMTKGILKFSIIPLFIINEYTFNIFIELFLVLLASFLGILVAVSDTNPKYHQVKKVLNWCLTLIGLYVVIFAFRSFFNSIDDVQEVIFWKKMFLELLLVCHIPLLILIQIASYYEQIMIRLKIKTQLARNIKGRIMIYLILLKNCHLNKIYLDKALEKVGNNRIGSFRELNILLT